MTPANVTTRQRHATLKIRERIAELSKTHGHPHAEKMERANAEARKELESETLLITRETYEALTELATVARAIADEGFTATENDRKLAAAIKRLDALNSEAEPVR
jgi:hypothetical protein